MREELVEEKEKKSQLELFFESPKRAFSNSISVFKFFWSASLILATFAFSLIGILFKIASKGLNAQTIILIAASSMYLFVLLLYFILLRARLRGKDDWALKETIYNVKYFVKVIKVIVPITLLFNLIGKPVYDIIVGGFSGISIVFGLISFIIATSNMVKHVRTKEARKAKHKKKNTRK